MDTAETAIAFDALYDHEAGVWVASSAERITTEAPSRDELLDRLKVVVPDVLEQRLGRPAHNVKIVVNWQEMRTTGQTELMVA